MNGRKMLRGNWTQAMLITVLQTLLIGGVTLLEQSVRKIADVPETIGTGVNAYLNTSVASLAISVVFLLLLFLFIAPLQNGQAEWYWNLVEHEKSSIGDVFGWYGSLKLYGKSILLGLHVLWRMALWAIPVYAAPGALLAVYAFVLGGADTLLANFVLVCALVLTVCASIAFAFVFLRYFPARYLLVEDNTRSANDCVRTAARYTRGFRWELFKFQLSYILWFALCYFVLPILYVQPYYNASAAVLARHIIFTQRAKERLKEQTVQKDDGPETEK